MNDRFISLHKSADKNINAVRTQDLTLTLKEGGKPLANREVTIEQAKHKFLFGVNGFRLIPLVNGELEGDAKEREEKCAKLLLDFAGFITLPFYWGGFEPKQGKPDTQRILKAAKWFVEKGCVVKGHPLCWHTFCADWLMKMSNADILKTQIERIRRELNDFKGVIETWDVINEAVIMPIFNKYDNGITRICKELGRIKTIRAMFETARESGPGATLIINDFDYTTPYEILIEGCLEAGIPIDVIGIQSHMHQGYWGVEKTKGILERYARFNLPIHFSETTLVSGHLMPSRYEDLNDYKALFWPSTKRGEARQAEEAVLHYKTLFAHPSVEANTWWDLVDGAWLNAPSGLVRKDMTPKPAYVELMKLIKGEWWVSPTELKTDAEGKLRVNCFLGDYSIRCGDSKASFSLDKAGEGQQSLSI